MVPSSFVKRFQDLPIRLKLFCVYSFMAILNMVKTTANASIKNYNKSQNRMGNVPWHVHCSSFTFRNCFVTRCSILC